MGKVHRCNIASHWVENGFRSVLSIFFTESKNQFRNYEFQFLRIFWPTRISFICNKLSVCMQLLFSPKILIQENSRFVISELVVGSDEQYIHLQHNSNLHKTDKKNILTMKMEKKIRIRLLKWFQLIVCQIRKLPNKWAWNTDKRTDVWSDLHVFTLKFLALKNCFFTFSGSTIFFFKLSKK